MHLISFQSKSSYLIQFHYIPAVYHGAPILRRREFQDVCFPKNPECYQSETIQLTERPRNGTIKSVTDIVHHLNFASLDSKTEVVIAPPGLFLLLVREHLKNEIEVCSQNVFDKPNGAFTGEISAEQLSDSKIGWALCGHSERRVILGETDDVRSTISFGLEAKREGSKGGASVEEHDSRDDADSFLLECSLSRVRRRPHSTEA